MRSVLLTACLVLSGASSGFTAKALFNPRNYPKSAVTCPAINRAENKQVDIVLHYVDINPQAKTTLLFLHGWPGLWASWKYQIEEFQSDYRIIAPDLRGFGASTHPGDVRSSGTMPDLVGDLLCILEHAGAPGAIAVGHDWGTQLAYEAARERPDIFTAVVGITIPYMPYAGPFVPTRALVAAHPRLAYQVFFDAQTHGAATELDRDIRRTLRATLRHGTSPPPEDFLTSSDTFLGAWDHFEEIPEIVFLSKEEEDYWVEQYSIQGFKHTLQFYTNENRLAAWNFANEQGNHTIPQPALSILATKDRVADMELAAKLLHSFDFLPDHTLHRLPTGHWTHLEDPDEVNNIIRKWLTKLDAKQEHTRDEL